LMTLRLEESSESDFDEMPGLAESTDSDDKIPRLVESTGLEGEMWTAVGERGS
jgi:hypothetical protein